MVDGETFRIGGETFSIDLAPALSVPSGQQLADLYADPNALAVITVDGQPYALDDGSRTTLPSQNVVTLITGQGQGQASLSSLSAVEVAALIAEAIRLAPPPNTVVGNLDFLEAQDRDPNATDGRDDRTFEAIPLPYQGGNVTLVGQGQIGNDLLLGEFDETAGAIPAPDNLDDVDLFRMTWNAQSTLAVNVDGPVIFGGGSAVAVRFFDANGLELNDTDPVSNQRTFTRYSIRHLLHRHQWPTQRNLQPAV